jgi:hypothetical protein
MGNSNLKTREWLSRSLLPLKNSPSENKNEFGSSLGFNLQASLKNHGT